MCCRTSIVVGPLCSLLGPFDSLVVPPFVVGGIRDNCHKTLRIHSHCVRRQCHNFVGVVPVPSWYHTTSLPGIFCSSVHRCWVSCFCIVDVHCTVGAFAVRSVMVRHRARAVPLCPSLFPILGYHACGFYHPLFALRVAIWVRVAAKIRRCLGTHRCQITAELRTDFRTPW